MENLATLGGRFGLCPGRWLGLRRARRRVVEVVRAVKLNLLAIQLEPRFPTDELLNVGKRQALIHKNLDGRLHGFQLFANAAGHSACPFLGELLGFFDEICVHGLSLQVYANVNSSTQVFGCEGRSSYAIWMKQ